MLTLTENATTVIRSLGARPELSEGAGLRITSAADGPDRLAISTASTPEAGDQVVDNEGARVFLEPRAAEVLDDKVLDARVDDQGTVEFLLVAQ
jgi:Fe-S cluster assembly iron-binding protein IscA